MSRSTPPTLPANGAWLVLGNQLFPRQHLPPAPAPIIMIEDVGLCTCVAHHQQKLVLFLGAMRDWADARRRDGYQLHYHQLDVGVSDYEATLLQITQQLGVRSLGYFEVEDHFFAARLDAFCQRHGLNQQVANSPMFLTSRQQFKTYLADSKKPFMADFYQRQRQRLNVLLEPDGKPRGGKWSLDGENRKKLPAKVNPPSVQWSEPTANADDVIALVSKQFADHPGDARQFCWPTTRQQALAMFQQFLSERLFAFGDYQDAMTTRSDTLFHSAISPALNLGLVTPQELLDACLDVAEHQNVPLNCIEGFVRQLIGWREFVRGIYHEYDQQQQETNFWNHHRKLANSWWRGQTGIPPLDDAIDSTLRLGWSHHIQRLMIFGNMMTLCEVEPTTAHDWFMAMHIDSSDWVMGPNVYGMALFADGGIFATKPYICGSNYWLKMSDYKRGDWCDTVDGLYWRFIEKHLEYFAKNPRLSVMTRALNNLKPERKQRIFDAAEQFLEQHTLL